MRTEKAGRRRLFERDEETTRAVAEMLRDIEARGMDAVRHYSRQLDAWCPDRFELTEAQIHSALAQVPEELRRDTEWCQANVRAFAQAQLATLQPLEVEIRPGIVLGHRHIPVNAVGSYVPGGQVPLFSSAHMSIIPAKVAGVGSIVACTPPGKGRGAHPGAVHAIRAAGAHRIFVVGGVPAMAMMALGLESIEPVDILCGAGNKYVTEAKRLLFGRCGVDLLAGPSEGLIIADDEADPALVACDTLAQAEHDPHACLCVVCLSESFAHRVLDEVRRQVADLPTREVAEAAWRENGIVVVAESPEEAVAISDDYAPEHLELHVRDPDAYAERLTNYGSLFLGEETSVAYADTAIGTNHILPTSRAARYTGGVWVGKFLKTCTWQRVAPGASGELAAVAERQCRREQLPGHAASCRARLDRSGKGPSS